MYEIDFKKPIHVHFMGIGGISMSGLAEILLKEQFTISGSDMKPSALTEHLTSLGASIFYPQKAENIIEGIDVVVYTAAIHEDNPEFAAAKAKGIKFGRPSLPLPDNFYDNYEGRLAAQKQHMSIDKDMDIVYDLKMADKENEIHSSELEYWGRVMYSLERMNEAQKAVWDAHYSPIIAKFKKDKLTGKALAEWKFQQYMRDYLRVITSVDRNIGRVLDYLEEKGMLENTMIVYTSDQGFYMGEHGWFDKRFMYEESFRTPLLVRLPGGKKGDVAELVQNIDYGPTILDLAGIEKPEEMHGESFLPLLKGEKVPEWRNSLYYHFYEYPAEHAVRRHFGVRTDRYKLIRYYNDFDCWELYDIQEDPSEMNNLYGKPGTEEITQELKAELKRLQEYYDDPIRKEIIVE